jgi:hypothetical protein
MKAKKNKKKYVAVSTLALAATVVAPQVQLLSQGNHVAHAAIVENERVQKEKEALTKVSVAERINFPEYTEIAYQSVIVLSNQKLKAQLLERLDKLKSRQSIELIDIRLDLMEENQLIQDQNYIQSLLKNVNSSSIKNEIQAKLTKIQDRRSIYSTDKRIDVIQKYRIEEDIAFAKAEIAKIQDPKVKADLTKRLVVASDKVYAQSVESLFRGAEYTLNLKFIDDAKTTIAKIQDTKLKSYLTERAKILEGKIRNTLIISRPFEKAYRSVELAEKEPTAYNLVYAKETVSTVRDTKVRNSLEARIKVTELRFNYEQAAKRVEILERTKENTDLVLAKALLKKIGNLPDFRLGTRVANVENSLISEESSERFGLGPKFESYDAYRIKSLLPSVTDPNLKSRLTQRLNEATTALDFAKAKKYVEAVELSRLASDLPPAKNAVAKLPNSSSKTELQKRLAAVERAISQQPPYRPF